MKQLTKTLPLLLFALAATTVLLGACTGYGEPMTPAPSTDQSPPPPVYDEPDPAPQPTYDQSASLHDRVHAALERAPSLSNTNITVRIQGSVVYLGGEVDTLDQKRIAHDVAHAVEGVTNVHYDDIRVN